MHEFPVFDLANDVWPPLLKEIPQPPRAFRARGSLPSPDTKLLAVVGSRKYSGYGKDVVNYLIDGLRGYDIGIISGLALGIDSLAHEAALRNNLYTLAIPGSGLGEDVLYPARHKKLARQILESGGGLLSEFEDDFKATSWSFPQRNRLVCGMSHATLLIEAAPKSGTLITARLASDYNRELLVVPGNIFSEGSKGVHQFLKLGAMPVTTPEDILTALRIEPDAVNTSVDVFTASLSPLQQTLISLLTEPLTVDELIRTSKADASRVTTALIELELLNFITKQGNTYRRT